MTLNDVVKTIAIDNTTKLYVNERFIGKVTQNRIYAYQDCEVVEIKHDILAKEIKIYMEVKE